MSTRPRRRPKSTTSKLVELSLAAPQVVAHRLTRMALAGPVPNARDRREFTGMVTEKQLAFAQSWLAMWGELVAQQQALGLSLLSGAFTGRRPAGRAASSLSRIVGAGMDPVHRKAVANAKRLRRTRLR
jgi:hypothetical protein